MPSMGQYTWCTLRQAEKLMSFPQMGKLSGPPGRCGNSCDPLVSFLVWQKLAPWYCDFQTSHCLFRMMVEPAVVTNHHWMCQKGEVGSCSFNHVRHRDSPKCNGFHRECNARTPMQFVFPACGTHFGCLMSVRCTRSSRLGPQSKAKAALCFSS